MPVVGALGLRRVGGEVEDAGAVGVWAGWWVNHDVVFGCRVFLSSHSVVTCRGWPGSHSLSLLRQRKGRSTAPTKKKGERREAALRVRVKIRGKTGNEKTRLRLRQFSFLIRFTAHFDASFQAQFVRRDLIWSKNNLRQISADRRNIF